MGLSSSVLCLSRAPFHRIVPGVVASPVDQVTLPVTFGPQEKFCTEYMQFEVADFEIAYNVFHGRWALTEFMTIPHYAYFVLMMSCPN
jgi:hypothetical protein